MKNKTKVRTSIIITITLALALAFTRVIYYSQTNISMWGFNVPKNELKDVLIQAKDSDYLITDPKLVLELAQEVSKMKILYKVDSSNYSPEEAPTKYFKLIIRGNSNFSGSFWKESGIVLQSNGIMLQSNGYYWIVSNELLELMDKSLKDAQKLH